MAAADTSSNPSSKIESLLVVRLGSMGDVIHTLPAVTALRRAYPEAKLGWVIEERWAELLCTLSTPRSGPRTPQRPLVDHIHITNTAKWRRSPLAAQAWLEMAAAWSDLRALHYPIAVDFQGALRSGLIARWSGASTIYGGMQPRENAASMFYTRQVMTRGVHVVEQNLSLAEGVAGRELHVPRVEFPCDEAAEQDCERRLRTLGAHDFVILNPGAGWGAKQWPAERYGEVARQLAESDLKLFINFGPGEENLAHRMEAASGGCAKAIECSLTQLIALTRRARLFIGGDTGPMHLAAALGVPVVGIFGPTNPARNGPFGTRSRVLRSSSSVTSHSRRAKPEPGLLEITPGEVVEAAHDLLKENHG